MNTQFIQFEVKDNVAYIGFGKNSKKSMSVLNIEILKELKDLLVELKTEQYKNLNGTIFHSIIPGCFIAGMDINVISSLQNESQAAQGAEQGQEIMNLIEDWDCPTVACVDGVCFGGGLELALACRHLLVSDSSKTQLAVPEVKLGLLPGFGGTYRLPIRVGLPTALEMILTGKTIRAPKAAKLGLADEIYPGGKLLEMAVKFFDRPKFYKRKSGLKQSLENLATDSFIGRKIVFQKARESVMEKTHGHYQAPLKILDLMEQSSSKNRSSYLELEASAFGELCMSEQSANLRHIFFMQDDAKKWSGPSSNQKLKVNRGAVLGAGTMGGGIAWLFADNGQRPIMKDIAQAALELGLKQSGKIFQSSVKKKQISIDEFERKQRSIICQTDYAGFSKVDLVIEAIVEDMEIKKKVFKETEKHVRPDCLLTSNTSSLSITEMASVLEMPGRFAGLHFFNPVNKMPLVEIISHDKVDNSTLESLYEWCVKQKKTPVVVKDGPGFLVNRMLMPYINESLYLLSEGVSVESLDQACLNFGMPMGPCRLMDEVGLDVLVKVAKIMQAGLGARASACELGYTIAQTKSLGRKTNKGFFLYDSSGKNIGANSEVHCLLKQNLSMDETTIQSRVFMPMINEASYILEEKIVAKPKDVDLGMIFGVGFPPFRGGPLKYADKVGLQRILDNINEFSKSVNADRYKAAPLLVQLVEQKKKFYDL